MGTKNEVKGTINDERESATVKTTWQNLKQTIIKAPQNTITVMQKGKLVHSLMGSVVILRRRRTRHIISWSRNGTLELRRKGKKNWWERKTKLKREENRIHKKKKKEYGRLVQRDWKFKKLKRNLESSINL